jgi:hypothetical protein
LDARAAEGRAGCGSLIEARLQKEKAGQNELPGSSYLNFER